MKFRCLYTCKFKAIFMNRPSTRCPIADPAKGIEEGQTARGQGKDAEGGAGKTLSIQTQRVLTGGGTWEGLNREGKRKRDF